MYISNHNYNENILTATIYDRLDYKTIEVILYLHENTQKYKVRLSIKQQTTINNNKTSDM